ncbi:NADH:ubiquinone oxidoreductase [Podospora australis]|uniref:NADH:ubiquinone oxidoreductase n=1 Tax=Podospora australis TaxID=1536484 RepID=A0AAN6X2C9_9PEZI|nr:NADH:ubiquinone oxidoreductase [Podospora australis]
MVEHGIKHLFGYPDRPWKESDWTASDDRVRGGKSLSSLKVVVVEGNDTTSAATSTTSVAVFAGHLDITALGGAGFASQRTVDDAFHPHPLDLRGYDGLLLDVDLSRTVTSKKYTLILKDTVLPKRPDGREQSTLSWEIDFSLAEPGSSTGTLSDQEKVQLLFKDFRATYRGKPVDEPESPLDLGGIKRISIMIRSFFGEQEGDFELGMKSLAAIKAENNES